MYDNNLLKGIENYKYGVYKAKNMLNIKMTLNQQLSKSSEYFDIFSENKIEKGILSVGVFTALQALPVKGAEVTVYDFLENGTEHIHAHSITDGNGKIHDIELPVQHDPLQLYGSTKYHFTTYNIRVTADNFYPVNILNFRIFPGEKTSYIIDMFPVIPGETVYTPEQTIIIPKSPIDEH